MHPNANNSSNVTDVFPTDTDSGEDRRIVLTFLVGFLIICTLTANFFVCITILKFKVLRTVTNYFVLNLCISDILFALFNMPIWMATQFYEHDVYSVIGIEFSQVYIFVDILCGAASILSLSCISIDRWLAITKPLTYHEMMTEHTSFFFIAGTWLYSLILAVLKFAVQWEGREYAFISTTAAFLVPLSIILICYFKIFLVARMQARTMDRSLKRELKAAQTIFVVIASFVCFWLPFFVLIMIQCFQEHFIPPFETSNAIKSLTYVNTFLNPIVYTCVNKSFKSTVRRKMKNCCFGNGN